MAAYYRPRYSRWYRGSRTRVPRPVAIAAAALVAAAAAGTAGHTGHHHHHHHQGARVASIPVAGSYTPYSWARAFLAAASLPTTACNRVAVVLWERAEGGHWGNSARYNPLDTTQREAGSSPINSVKVQAFTSWHQGLAASVTTIYNGHYPGILAAFHAGNDAQAVADAIAASPWGTQPFSVTVSC